MSWAYCRDKYYSRRDAVEAYRPSMLEDPRIASSLAQIDMATAYIDKIMEEASENDRY